MNYLPPVFFQTSGKSKSGIEIAILLFLTVCLGFSLGISSLYSSLSFLVFLIIPIFLAFLEQSKTILERVLLGLFFGFGLFLRTTASGICYSIHIYGNINFYLAGLITFLVLLFLSLRFVFFAILINGQSGWYVPTFWVFTEWIQFILPFGIPWNFVGEGQSRSILSGYLPIFGILGLSWITIFLSSLIYAISKRNHSKKIKNFFFILLIFFVGFLFNQVKWTKKSERSINVVIFQPNIDPREKWLPENHLEIADQFLNWTQKSLGKGNLLIWPEDALPIAEPMQSNYLGDVSKLLKKHKKTLIVGTPLFQRGKIFNSIQIVGESFGIYKKRRLFPFGDFIPFRSILQPFLDLLKIPNLDLTPGPNQQDLLKIARLKAALLICYEVLFPDLVRSEIVRGADFIITITDDSWFGDSAIKRQHLEAGRIRAIETGRYLVIGSNNGISGVFNPSGRLTAAIKESTFGKVSATVFSMTGKTPWIIWGNFPLYLLFLVSAIKLIRKAKKSLKIL